MPKKSKNLCVDDLRHAEYYGMQPVFDKLYRRSLDGDNFTDLMDIILSRDIINPFLLALLVYAICTKKAIRCTNI